MPLRGNHVIGDRRQEHVDNHNLLEPFLRDYVAPTIPAVPPAEIWRTVQGFMWTIGGQQTQYDDRHPQIWSTNYPVVQSITTLAWLRAGVFGQGPTVYSTINQQVFRVEFNWQRLTDAAGAAVTENPFLLRSGSVNMTSIGDVASPRYVAQDFAFGAQTAAGFSVDAFDNISLALAGLYTVAIKVTWALPV